MFFIAWLIIGAFAGGYYLVTTYQQGNILVSDVLSAGFITILGFTVPMVFLTHIIWDMAFNEDILNTVVIKKKEKQNG